MSIETMMDMDDAQRAKVVGMLAFNGSPYPALMARGKDESRQHGVTAFQLNGACFLPPQNLLSLS
jgi:hypothetical protein